LEREEARAREAQRRKQDESQQTDIVPGGGGRGLDARAQPFGLTVVVSIEAV